MVVHDIIILPIIMLSLVCIIPIVAFYTCIKERCYPPVVIGEIVDDEFGI